MDYNNSTMQSDGINDREAFGGYAGGDRSRQF